MMGGDAGVSMLRLLHHGGGARCRLLKSYFEADNYANVTAAMLGDEFAGEPEKLCDDTALARAWRCDSDTSQRCRCDGQCVLV